MILLLLFTLLLILATAFFQVLIYFFPNWPWPKIGTVAVLFSLTLFLCFLGVKIFQRYSGTDITSGVHDGIIQAEVALSFLSKGVNPYGTDYFGTELEEYKYSDLPVNPALYHFAYLPGILVLGAPGYFGSHYFFDFYDQRLIHALLLTLLVGWLVFRYRDKSKLIILVPLLFFNFWFMTYFVFGLNDILIIALVILAMEFIMIRKYWLSAIIFGLALATKQTAWFAAPFLVQFFWHWARQVNNLNYKKVQRSISIWLGTVIITVVIVVLPFWANNPAAFWADTVGYQLGQTSNTYPIYGIGLGEIIYQIGLVPERTSYFPFWAGQFAIVGLFIWYVWKYQWHHRIEPWQFLWLWTLFLGGIWFFNRYFTITHLASLMVMASMAYFYKIINSDKKKEFKVWFGRPLAGIIKR